MARWSVVSCWFVDDCIFLLFVKKREIVVAFMSIKSLYGNDMLFFNTNYH